MTTQLTAKLIALSAALLMNAMLLGSVAYLFNGQSRPAGLSSYAWSGVTVVANAKA